MNATVNNKCGLVISTSYPWLAATPDGWVNDPTATLCQGLVEFKNSYAYRNLSLEDAITTKMCKCLTINNDHKQLKRAHSYYYQVQMAMFCTRWEWCDFFICTTVDCLVNKLSLIAPFVFCFFLSFGGAFLLSYQNQLWNTSRFVNHWTGFPMCTVGSSK